MRSPKSTLSDVSTLVSSLGFPITSSHSFGVVEEPPPPMFDVVVDTKGTEMEDVPTSAVVADVETGLEVVPV